MALAPIPEVELAGRIRRAVRAAFPDRADALIAALNARARGADAPAERAACSFCARRHGQAPWLAAFVRPRGARTEVWRLRRSAIPHDVRVVLVICAHCAARIGALAAG